MEKGGIEKSELVLTPEDRIYHLHLYPGELADTVFLVGDPARVYMMSSLFDSIEHRVENREFVTHTGYYRDKRISVVSTGIGTDNIDIVVNELDALVNIDFKTRRVRKENKSLTLIRIGTSGALHAEIGPGSVLFSGIAGGIDNLMHFYALGNSQSDQALQAAFTDHMGWNESNSLPYFIPASDSLFSLFNSICDYSGITLSAPGFYGPQGRSIRTELADPLFIEKLRHFRFGDQRIINFEMEGSALYGLSALLGHNAATICLALANRESGKFLTNYKSQMLQLLENVLNRITDNG